MPSLAAKAAVWRAWFDCVAPWVITISAPIACASAIRNSSLRVLLPPVERPVQSSRLIQISGPPRSRLSRSSRSSGVGRWARKTRGKRARCMCVLLTFAYRTVAGRFLRLQIRISPPIMREIAYWGEAMRLEWLEDILAVAETGSFHEAARSAEPDAVGLFAAHPADRGQIGVELFDRSRKPVQLRPTTAEQRDQIAKLAGRPEPLVRRSAARRADRSTASRSQASMR
jgi:hypothetical protein